MATPNPAKKKPTGKPAVLAEAESDEVAAPDHRDAQRGGILVKASVLIAAIWAGVIVWDRARGQYRYAAGYIPYGTLRQEAEKVVTLSRANVRSISQRLLDRSVSLAEWQYGMRDELKALHMVMWSVAQGGTAEMSPASLLRAGAVTRSQYDYLNKFAAAVDTGQQPMNGVVLTRAGLYANAGRRTYTESQKDEFKARRVRYAERVRHADESCADCVEWEGFWDIDEIPEIGASVCAVNCRCEILPVEELGPNETLNSSVGA